ncbi:unnamed protein product [Agarophyton chilense]|eukprot:gb/GEZJ01002878.1/.p1 GENE.gb/GEZJ01002878.1/~~gb/GEZJ01002878.1/.p1  ORF type:complete len:391 (-),score=74.91 gb/GEZJ01002878.1/:2525-3697(-)
MGKRRRSNGKKNKSKATEKSAGATKTQTNADEANDVDASCVHYASSSEENPGNAIVGLMSEKLDASHGLGSDSDGLFDSDHSEEDDEDKEYTRDIMLTRNKDDESDVELSVEFFDPRERDVSAITMFLLKYCNACTSTSKGKEQVTTARAVAEVVCGQTRVGTTIRLSEEDTPVGFISCINVREYMRVLKNMKRKLIQVAEKEKNEKFIALLNKCMEGSGRFESERMGLVLCERVMNMPTLVVANMLKGLCLEIEWATEDEKTQEQRNSFRFGWYLYITEMFCYEEEGEKSGSAKESKKKKRQRVEKEVEEHVAFGRVEDSGWHEHANCSISWDWGEAEDGVRQKRIAMIVSAKNMGKIREMVEHSISDTGGKEGEEAVDEGAARGEEVE